MYVFKTLFETVGVIVLRLYAHKLSKYVTEKVGNAVNGPVRHYREGFWNACDVCIVDTSFSETVCIYGHVSL